MKKITFKFLLIFMFVSVCMNGYSQKSDEAVEEIRILFEKLFYAEGDNLKDSLNVLILNRMEKYLQNIKNDFSDLESIKNLSALSSDDNYVFIFTWSVLYSDNKFKYFGFIKYYSEEMQYYHIDKLNHQSKDREGLNSMTVLPEDWYGAVYYSIILKKYKGDRHYVILGWDGNDNFTNKKIIDILVIEENEIPVFGKDVFYTDKGVKKRFIFEYAERVNMILRYDKGRKMIIWDHLSPSKKELTGHYEYYGPDMTYDGLIFEKGIWKFISDVDLTLY